MELHRRLRNDLLHGNFPGSHRALPARQTRDSGCSSAGLGPLAYMVSAYGTALRVSVKKTTITFYFYILPSTLRGWFAHEVPLMITLVQSIVRPLKSNVTRTTKVYSHPYVKGASKDRLPHIIVEGPPGMQATERKLQGDGRDTAACSFTTTRASRDQPLCFSRCSYLAVGY